jgi:hypothetical protein
MSHVHLIQLKQVFRECLNSPGSHQRCHGKRCHITHCAAIVAQFTYIKLGPSDILSHPFQSSQTKINIFLKTRTRLWALRNIIPPIFCHNNDQFNSYDQWRFSCWFVSCPCCNLVHIGVILRHHLNKCVVKSTNSRSIEVIKHAWFLAVWPDTGLTFYMEHNL